jgi:hypothetical protein
MGVTVSPARVIVLLSLGHKRDLTTIGVRYNFEIAFRSGCKTPSKAQWLRCKLLQNAHILPCMLRFFIGLRLALEPNLRF